MDEMTKEEFQLLKNLIILELSRAERAETMEQAKEIITELKQTIESK